MGLGSDEFLVVKSVVEGLFLGSPVPNGGFMVVVGAAEEEDSQRDLRTDEDEGSQRDLCADEDEDSQRDLRADEDG